MKREIKNLVCITSLVIAIGMLVGIVFGIYDNKYPYYVTMDMIDKEGTQEKRILRKNGFIRIFKDINENQKTEEEKTYEM